MRFQTENRSIKSLQFVFSHELLSYYKPISSLSRRVARCVEPRLAQGIELNTVSRPGLRWLPGPVVSGLDELDLQVPSFVRPRYPNT